MKQRRHHLAANTKSHLAKGKAPHQVQIIGGEYRSRKIEVIDAEGLRPTASRVRETLFNWLQMTIPGSIVIDAFAGTGALGIEALSRGAKKAIFIEKDPIVFKTLQKNITHLQIDPEKYRLLNTDSLQFLHSSNPQLQSILTEINASDTRCHLFLDPPFFAGLYPELLTLLTDSELLRASSSLSIELPIKLTFATESPLAPLKVDRELKTKESLLQLYRR